MLHRRPEKYIEFVFSILTWPGMAIICSSPPLGVLYANVVAPIRHTFSVRSYLGLTSPFSLIFSSSNKQFFFVDFFPFFASPVNFPFLQNFAFLISNVFRKKRRNLCEPEWNTSLFLQRMKMPLLIFFVSNKTFCLCLLGKFKSNAAVCCEFLIPNIIMHYFNAHVYVHTSAWEIVCEKCWGSLNVRLCPPNHATLSAQSCDSPPKLWTLGECWPLCSPPVVNCLYHLEECRGNRGSSLLGDNFAFGGQVHPWRPTSPLVKVRP
jgi:hypothetical protein